MRRQIILVWIGLAALGCIALVVSLLLDARIAAIVSKMTASSAFVAVAVSAGALATRYGRCLLAGLGFSWFGDLFLLGQAEPWFLFGLISFLLAHIAYVIAFVFRGIALRWGLAAFVPVAIISFAVLAWLSPYLADDMAIPVLVYTFVISLMVITAFAARGAGGPTLIPIGAVLFYFSDLSVAAGQFVQPDFPNYVWGLPFYYCGQVLLALSVAISMDRSAKTVKS